MRPVVLDASVVMSILSIELSSAEVQGTLRRLERVGARFAAPGLLWLEVVNALVRRRKWSGAEVIEALHEIDGLGITMIEPDRATILSILDLAERLGLSAYDAAYLALAEAIDGRLFTIDGALALAAGPRALGAGEAIHERAEPYERRPTWPAWPGASAYLAKLRAEARATASRPRGQRPGGSGSASRPGARTTRS